MKIIFKDDPLTFLDALNVSLISMIIVFIILIFITYLVSLLKYLPNENKIQSKKIIQKSKEELINLNNPEEEAIISILVASIKASKKQDNSYFKIKSIKKLN